MSAVFIHKKKKCLDRVDVRVCDHCNLNCKSCTQFSPLAKPEFVDVTTFTNDFRRLHELTNGDIKEVHLKGGEPLLHPQILELLEIIRGIFDKNRIILLTNGILLSKQSDLFWNTCRDKNIEIQISHYPINIKYQLLRQTAKKHNVKLRYLTSKPQNMFKWSFDLEGKQNVKENFNKCFMGNFCIQVDSGKLFNCAVIPTCVKHFNSFFDKDMQISPDDYIDIYKPDITLGMILDFLSQPIPFCRYCYVNKTLFGEKWAPSNRSIDEWV